MVMAALYDGPYNVVYLLHIVAVIIGTGAAFLAPVLTAKVGKLSQSADAIDDALAAVMAPALLLAGIFGSALVSMSDDFYDFGQSWLAIAGTVWIVTVVAAALAYPPSYVKLPDLSEKKAMLGGIMHLSLTIMIIIMVWKPGSPF